VSLLTKGARVVTAADDYLADVFVAEDTVTTIAATLDIPADHVIDAAGCYLLPGGVDPHTHLGSNLGSTTTSDDYESGTVAAAFGGTTQGHRSHRLR
jgi:dihydropyrimidinase